MRNSGKQKDNELELKDEKNNIKACGALDGGSDEMAEEDLNSGKEKMKTLGTRIYSSRTNSEEKEFLGDDEIIIRITLCLSSIKIN